MAGLDSNRGAKRARETREALGRDALAPLPCLLSIVEEALGLPVVVAALPEDVAGACWRNGDATVLWVNGVQAAVRRRFTLAHEVGHVRCGHEDVEVDSMDTVAGTPTTPREIQANAFAAELLFPRAAAMELVNGVPTLEDVVTLAAHYGVSALATLFRIASTGRLSQARADRLRAEIHENEHLAVAARLGLAPFEDRLGAIGALPYASPALDGSALVSAVRGDASAFAAADAAGVAAADLAPALATLVAPRHPDGRPPRADPQ